MKKVVLAFIIIIFVFSCNRKTIEDANVKHLNNLANTINSDLNSVSQSVIELTSKIQIGIPFEDPVNKNFEKYYYYKNDQVLYTSFKENNSAVYYPANKEITKALKNRIINTEKLDPLFSEITIDKSLIEQVYFLDTNSFLRIYPYVDVINYLKSSVDLTTLMTYKNIERAPFNSKKGYWVKNPYADPYGRGWIISCSQPIYYRDCFKGIISGNISVKTIKDNYFSSNTESLFLLNHEGKLIVWTKEAGKIINAPVYKEFQYYKPVESDIFIYCSPSLIEHQNKSLKKAIDNLLKNKTSEEFNISNKRYKIYRSYIPETDWYLFKIIN